MTTVVGRETSADMAAAARVARGANGGDRPNDNRDFNNEWQELVQREAAMLANRQATQQDYAAELARLDEERRRFLEKWKDSPNLSAEQRQDLQFASKAQAYSQQGRQITEAYKANPTDPAARAAYEKRQADRSELIDAAARDPELGQYQSVRRVQELQTQLRAAVGNPQREEEIRGQMSVARREMMNEIMNDPDGPEKVMRFVNRNQNLTAIRESGLGEYARTVETRLAALRSERRGGVGDETVTPDGAARTGGVSGPDGVGRSTATREAGAGVDDGRGGYSAPSYAAERATSINVPTGGVPTLPGGTTRTV